MLFEVYGHLNLTRKREHARTVYRIREIKRLKVFSLKLRKINQQSIVRNPDKERLYNTGGIRMQL